MGKEVPVFRPKYQDYRLSQQFFFSAPWPGHNAQSAPGKYVDSYNFSTLQKLVLD